MNSYFKSLYEIPLLKVIFIPALVIIIAGTYNFYHQNKIYSKWRLKRRTFCESTLFSLCFVIFTLIGFINMIISSLVCSILDWLVKSYLKDYSLHSNATYFILMQVLLLIDIFFLFKLNPVEKRILEETKLKKILKKLYLMIPIIAIDITSIMMNKITKSNYVYTLILYVYILSEIIGLGLYKKYKSINNYSKADIMLEGNNLFTNIPTEDIGNANGWIIIKSNKSNNIEISKFRQSRVQYIRYYDKLDDKIEKESNAFKDLLSFLFKKDSSCNKEI